MTADPADDLRIAAGELVNCAITSRGYLATACRILRDTDNTTAREKAEHDLHELDCAIAAVQELAV